MRLCSIASGSSGNCIYIGSENTHLLVDAGISRKKIEEGLAKLNLTGDMLDGILITHEHTDHIQGLGVFCRKYKIPVFGTPGTLQGILAYKQLGAVPEGIFREVFADCPFEIGDLTIKPFTISHDAKEPTGFRITGDGKSVAVATDLGFYDDYTIHNLKDLCAVVLEANHDVHMLEVGPYPYPLKQRVLGNCGHLSNEASGRLLCQILHDGLKHIVLGHLSKDNNFPELAYETVKLEVTMGNVPYNGDELSLMVAKRDEISKILYV